MDGAGKSKKDLLVISIFEGIGTAILLIAINLSGKSGTNPPMVISLGLFTGAILSGRLTGAHFNPAVTIGVMVADDSRKLRKNLPLAIVMIIS